MMAGRLTDRYLIVVIKAGMREEADIVIKDIPGLNQQDLGPICCGR